MGLDESFLRVWAEENLVSEKSGSRRAVSERVEVDVLCLKEWK